MKTLYISDLDGTLLNKNAEVSDCTVTMLNKLIAEGLYFSIATARTAATVVKMLENININTPIILMNGVCIYDLIAKKYIKTEKISDTAKKDMLSIIKKHHLSGFLYTIDNDVLNTYYENTDSPNAKDFIKERTEKFGKVFTLVKNFTLCIEKNIVYYSISDKKEKLDAAYEQILTVEDLHIEYYCDIYKEDYWYLEICSNTASKYNATEFLKIKYGFDKVIGFGDNLNDLSLFEACDESYAVENAKQIVKDKAAGIIESNENNGVVKWILNNVVK